jgi:hypothetical protein
MTVLDGRRSSVSRTDMVATGAFGNRPLNSVIRAVRAVSRATKLPAARAIRAIRSPGWSP